MPFDDDDSPSHLALSAPGSEEAAAAADEELEDAVPDYLAFARSLKSKGKGGLRSNAIRRGEKDFESHGTLAQENTLEESRRVMEDILSYVRVHPQGKWHRAWYFPDWWTEEKPVLDKAETSVKGTAPVFRRERCVVLEKQCPAVAGSVGRQIPGMKEWEPGSQGIWLLPEEALFLLERGSIDLWWPFQELPELLPGLKRKATDNTDDAPKDPVTTDESATTETKEEPIDEDEMGVPLSLEAGYALLIGYEGERGKITLPKHQIYANLKRAGFHVLRAPPKQHSQGPTNSGLQIWQWIISLLRPTKIHWYKPQGPLLRPGVYRNYGLIYPQLELIQRHQPPAEPQPAEDYDGPFQVFYHVWKSDGRPFSRARPARPPDFRVAIVDARETCVPTAREAAALFGATPLDPPGSRWSGTNAGHIYQRLGHGHHNVVLAVVDRGISSFIRLGDGAFGDEKLWERFDTQLNAKDKKGGKRSGNGRRGGRGGGRGRGRGGGTGGR